MKIRLFLIFLSVLFTGLILSYQFRIKIEVPVLKKYVKTADNKSAGLNSDEERVKLIKIVLPQKGIELPIKWGGLSKELIDNGVIDQTKFENLYRRRDEFNKETKQLIESANDSRLIMTENNSNVILNLFWAFGLANKNPILENGPMADSRYGGVEKFASTGGWDLAKGKAMDHYSRHELIKLTLEQQRLVENTAKNIYRPCCNNSTYFPDCNHGMAMLGLLELMAANGASEDEMYKVALRVNSYWFPGYYPVIAEYLETQGISWDQADPKEILGAKYSSASGYKQIEAKVAPSGSSKGSSCGA